MNNFKMFLTRRFESLLKIRYAIKIYENYRMQGGMAVAGVKAHHSDV